MKRFLSSVSGSDKTTPNMIEDFVREMKDERVAVTKAACQQKLKQLKELGVRRDKGKMVVPEALFVSRLSLLRKWGRC